MKQIEFRQEVIESLNQIKNNTHEDINARIDNVELKLTQLDDKIESILSKLDQLIAQ